MSTIDGDFSIGSPRADWDEYSIPADPGAGYTWELLPLSDEFNYTVPAAGKGPEFTEKWKDTYHNAWKGPGLTEWRRDHSWVEEGKLVIAASRKPGQENVYAGIITSRQRVVYPVYVEVRAKISKLVMASGVWMLSPDDTQEIDIVEAYGSDRPDQKWFAERVHLSHHVFIRSPFQDYQPKDPASWYRYQGTVWSDEFHRYGVYWRDPWHLEYYIDGELVRTVSGPSIIDPHNFTQGAGLNKAMDVIIDTEDQNWRSDEGITPTDEELADDSKRFFYVDWIRFYKPVPGTGGD
ncbi:MAG: glycosyl hydrolase family protein [Chloroflexi bacterium]|nr:MAG: glycosyl hydrolase family protein [Chloroflexota bacterium]